MFLFFFYRFYLFIFRERRREGEKHQCVVASHTPPTGDLARNPSLCPDQESNQQPFGSQFGTNPLSQTSRDYISRVKKQTLKKVK